MQQKRQRCSLLAENMKLGIWHGVLEHADSEFKWNQLIRARLPG